MKKFVANWKMNFNLSQTRDYLKEMEYVLDRFDFSKLDFIICPSFPYLYLFEKIMHSGCIKLGVQNIAKWPIGNYTGEVSANMVRDFDVSYALVGHSERRVLLQESSEDMSVKLSMLSGINPIYCIGENLEERRSGDYLEVIKRQLSVVKNFKGKISIAYEPIWAIGTGISAKNKEIQEVLNFIKSEMYSNADCDILYGGSVNVSNVNDLIEIDGLDGFLVGNASLSLTDSMVIATKLVEKDRYR